ncbi:YebC/PmpR family DNA-binding transcriptional regulator [bacterium]|nr:MAG: YebC/PmpR family DNA-binding transcriptional regulator [bacterium]
MSGHSKWASIKHKKAITDAKRGKLFTKLIREITVAARQGGGDINGNARLRTAVAAAKAANMPAENIERAIKKGTGELEGVSYEEVTYEGYGQGGVAIMLEVLTDNKKRTVAEIRHTFARLGGNLGEAGCVSWMFHKVGMLTVPKQGTEEEKLMEAALEAGANDFKEEDDFFEIYTEPSNVFDVRDKLIAKGFNVNSAEVTAIPQSTVHLEGKDAEKLLKLLYALEDNDDVQKVYSNVDIPDEIVERFQQ